MRDARPVRDPKALRALAHPLRWAIMELLWSEQPATATRCGELLGEPANSCSYHLRMLAKYGFVEEAGGGVGHERPWRLTSLDLSFSDAGDENADTAAAARAFSTMYIEREAARQRAWLRQMPNTPRRWRRAALSRSAIRWLTVQELEALNQEIDAIFDRYQERLVDADARPAGTRLVRLFAVAFPQPPPTEIR